jgi:hypothetical protein
MQFADERNILRIGHAAVFYYDAAFSVIGSLGLFLPIPGNMIGAKRQRLYSLRQRSRTHHPF